jgi:hypothetical protein
MIIRNIRITQVGTDTYRMVCEMGFRCLQDTWTVERVLSGPEAYNLASETGCIIERGY